MNLSQLKHFWSIIPSVPNCHGCGDCCSFAPHLKNESLLIEQFVKKHGLHLPEKRFGDQCIALNFENKCLIYPVRPTVCRLWGTLGRTAFTVQGVHLRMKCNKFDDVNINYQGDSEYQHLLRLYLVTLNGMKRQCLLGFTYQEFIQNKKDGGQIT